MLSLRHADQVGVLASILDQLREGGHNILEMENLIFQGGGAAFARIQIVGKPSIDILGKIRSSHHVFALSIKNIS